MAKGNQERFCSFLQALRVIGQVLCATPVIDPSGKVTMIRRVHNIWCLTVLLYIYVVSCMQSRVIDPKRPTIENALYYSEFFTNCVIVTTLISSAYYHVEQYREVPEKLRYLHIITKDYEIGPSIYVMLLLELRIFCFLVGSFFFACFAIDFVFNEYSILDSIRSSGSYNLPNLLATFSLGQFWITMRFICLIYKRLNNGLEKIQLLYTTADHYPQLLDEAQENGLPWTTVTNWYRREFSTSLQKNIKLGEYVDYIRVLYSELDALVTKLVDIFGFIILINLLSSFLGLAIQYFSIYKFYDSPNSLGVMLFIYKLFWLILHTGKTLFILLTSHAIIREKSRTLYILNELPSTSKEIEHAINRFQLQLMVRKSAETACGIIDLDMLFLGGFNSALATYIIFLIQIDLGNVSLQSSLNTTN